jgi:hypothetical protein
MLMLFFWVITTCGLVCRYSGRKITPSLDDRYRYTRVSEGKAAKRQHIRRDNPVLSCILSDVK